MDAPKAGAAEDEAAAPDVAVEEPNENAGVEELKPDAPEDALVLPIEELVAEPKENAEVLGAAAASGLAALAPKLKAVDEAPDEPESAVLLKMKTEEMGALPPVGAAVPKAKADDVGSVGAAGAV